MNEIYEKNLLEALRKGDVRSVKTYIKHVKVSYINDCLHYCLSLHSMSENVMIEVLSTLLNVDGVDINHPFNGEGSSDEKGSTILIRCSHYGQAKVVAFLLKCKSIDVNRQNENKYTALMTAIVYERYDVAELLSADKRVDRSLSNKYGSTAFTLACNKNTKLAEKLFPNDREQLLIALRSAFDENKVSSVALIINKGNLSVDDVFIYIILAISRKRPEALEAILDNVDIKLYVDKKTTEGETMFDFIPLADYKTAALLLEYKDKVKL